MPWREAHDRIRRVRSLYNGIEIKTDYTQSNRLPNAATAAFHEPAPDRFESEAQTVNKILVNKLHRKGVCQPGTSRLVRRAEKLEKTGTKFGY